jgi:hypothetical protein
VRHIVLSFDQYVRIANDVLFNPEGTIERVEQAYEEHLEADEAESGSQSDGAEGKDAMSPVLSDARKVVNRDAIVEQSHTPAYTATNRTSTMRNLKFGNSGAALLCIAICGMICVFELYE